MLYQYSQFGIYLCYKKKGADCNIMLYQYSQLNLALPYFHWILLFEKKKKLHKNKEVVSHSMVKLFYSQSMKHPRNPMD